MSFEVTGNIIEILPEENGTSARGTWKKLDFVIETVEEQYPKKIAFTLFNDKTSLLSGINQGAKVKVGFNVESREYNGKYFHNINAWKIETLSQPASTEATPHPANGGDDLPF